MKFRHTALVLALATLSAPAFAGATSTFVGGELGYVDAPTRGELSRQVVLDELQALRANPVAADGGQFVGGEAGYSFPQHMYAYKDGSWECVDNIAHNPAPDAIMSPAERARFEMQYPA